MKCNLANPGCLRYKAVAVVKYYNKHFSEICTPVLRTNRYLLYDIERMLAIYGEARIIKVLKVMKHFAVKDNVFYSLQNVFTNKDLFCRMLQSYYLGVLEKGGKT